MYIGYIISVHEAKRLLGDSVEVSSYYDTRPIDAFLSQHSTLRFEYIDKGSCVLGIPLEIGNVCVDDALIQIVQKKNEFKDQIKKLNIDTSTVILQPMEEAEVVVHNPEPLLIQV
jgi:hypothetical protein